MLPAGVLEKSGNFAALKKTGKTFVMKLKGDIRYYLLAVCIVAVWGSTFATTKILIQNGVTPLGIFFIRFLTAYMLLLSVCPHNLKSYSRNDELKFVAAGMLGGSVYYMLQNVALSLSQTTNVSFLLSFCPLITILLAILFFKDQHISKWHIIGLVIALCGVSFVIFNGQHELKITPAGDILALSAAVSWGFYTQLIRPLTRRYSSPVIARKVFFYGWLTAAPLFFTTSWRGDLSLLLHPGVALNILYLTLFASIFCYVSWNRIVERLGPVRGASFLYLDPVFATLFSFLFMNEVMTPVLAGGLCLILLGVFVAQRAGALMEKTEA